MNVLVFVFAVLVARSYGQTTHTEMSKHFFAALDANGNGQITPDEMMTSFTTLDSHGKGSVNRHELTEYICGIFPDVYNLSHYMYDKMDVDKDHHLESHDYTALFKLVDTDQSGTVDEAELDTFFASTFEQHGHSATHQHNHGHPHCH